MRLRCWIARRKLGALAAGELHGRKAEMVRAHLEVCPACAEEFASMDSALNALRHVGSEVKWGDAASAECWSAIRERLNRGKRRTVRRRIPVATPAVALVGVLLVAAGLWVGLVGTQKPNPENSPAERAMVPTETPAPEDIRYEFVAEDYLPVVQEYDFEVVRASDNGGWGRF